MNTQQRKLIAAASLCAGLFSASVANATPITVSVTGTVTAATGTMADELGNTITASFLFDLDRSVATYVDLDSSNNPGESFATMQELYSGAYGWSVSSSGGGSNGSTYVAYETYDNSVFPNINAGQPIDLLNIWGSNTTGVCPQAVLLAKGYCDQTDMAPGDGFELGLVLVTSVDWFSGKNLPSYIPGLSSMVGSNMWGTQSSSGIAVGDFSATVNSMTVSPAAVPVPGALWLFGSGLLGLIGLARRKTA